MRPGDLERLVAGYLKAARVRDRLALTQRARQRRQERFQLALKTLAKGMATEATRTVHERPLRLDIRTRIYGTMMVLARVTSEDHLAVVGRARNTLRWALSIAVLGFAGIVFTVLANGWLAVPVR